MDSLITMPAETGFVLKNPLQYGMIRDMTFNFSKFEGYVNTEDNKLYWNFGHYDVVPATEKQRTEPYFVFEEEENTYAKEHESAEDKHSREIREYTANIYKQESNARYQKISSNFKPAKKQKKSKLAFANIINLWWGQEQGNDHFQDKN